MSRTHGLRGINSPPFDGLADIRKFAIIRDDFIGGDTGASVATKLVGELGWNIWSLNSASGPATVNTLLGVNDGNHPGVVRLTSSNTTPADGDEQSMTVGGDNISLTATNPVYFGAVVKVPVLATTEAYVGLFTDADTVTALGVNSVCFEYDSVTGGNWLAQVTTSSTTTTVDTGVALVADTYNTLEFAATTAGVDFYVDGEHVASTSTNVPASTVELGVGVKIAASGAATETAIDVDAVIVRIPVDRSGINGFS